MLPYPEFPQLKDGIGYRWKFFPSHHGMSGSRLYSGITILPNSRTNLKGVSVCGGALENKQIDDAIASWYVKD
jgi:hypothetical protein